MRVIFILLLYALILGDGIIAFVASIALFKQSREHRMLLPFGILFLSIALFLLCLIHALEYVPRPTEIGYRSWMLIALIVLGLGVWIAALEVLGLSITESIRRLYQRLRKRKQ